MLTVMGVGAGQEQRAVRRIRVLASILVAGLVVVAARTSAEVERFARPVVVTGPVVSAGLRPARGRLLVATRGMGDPSFARSVILLVRYDARGATGLTINRRTRIKLAEVLPSIESLGGRSDTLYLGGPVQPERLFVLFRSHNASEDGTLVLGDVYLTASKETLGRIAARPRAALHAYAGYAGWAAGQLEAEIARGGWYVVPGKEGDVFARDPDHLWERLVDQGGGSWTMWAPR